MTIESQPITIAYLFNTHRTSHQENDCMSLAKHIAAKLKAEGLTPAQGATKAGITAVTFKAVLAGKSVPNKRSLGKYAKFLGLGAEETIALAGTRAKKAGKGKKPGKRGRPPGKKSGSKLGKRGRRAAGVAPGKLKAVSKQIARAQKVLAKLAGVVAKL